MEYTIEGLKYHRFDLDTLDKIPSYLPTTNVMYNDYGDRKPINEVVSHWAGSSYTGYSSHYQINICLDPLSKKPFILLADKSHFLNASLHSHTWKRNTGKIGTSLICMFDIKKYPVTPEMVDLNGRVDAILLKHFSLDVEDIRDHEDYAKLDGYTGLRWDCELKIDAVDTVSSKIKKLANQYHLNKPSIKPKVIPVVKQTPTIFEDVYKEDWYSIAIETMEKLGILAGYKEKNIRVFQPNNKLTRDQAFHILAETLLFINKQIELDLVIKFIWNSEYEKSMFPNSISMLHTVKLIKGDNTGNFNLDRNITRAELSVILANTMAFINNRLGIPEGIIIDSEKMDFIDVHYTDWFFVPVTTCYKSSLLVGYKEVTGHYFKPDLPLTRAEYSATIYKLLTKYKKLGKIKF